MSGAEITGAQRGWRFDFVILEPESAMAREVDGAREPSDEGITPAIADAQRLVERRFVHPALARGYVPRGK